jgi:hypothetical protein
MYFNEFKTYVEKNSRAADIFLNKAFDYLTEENNKRKSSARWSSSKIDQECEKMWEMTLKNSYNSVTDGIKAEKNKPLFYTHDDEVDYWIEFLNEKEFLEGFTDGISDMEFD